MPSLGLRVSGVFELQPAGCVVLVNAGFSLRHNPLKVTGTNFRKKGLPVLHDVLRIKQPWTLRGPDESRESLLSLDKGHPPQILAIEPQKVERVKDRLPFPAEQLVELAHTLRIDANNLAVNDGVLHGQLGERPLEYLKSKVPLIARNQLALAVLEIRDRPKTVVLQLENVVRMVKGLPHQTEPHGVNAWEHDSSLSLRLWMPAPPLGTRLLIREQRVPFFRLVSVTVVELWTAREIIVASEVRTGTRGGDTVPPEGRICALPSPHGTTASNR